jgi:phosphomannomutase
MLEGLSSDMICGFPPLAALEGAYQDARKDHLDGLRVEYDSWWFNLRASNTEPVMRLNLEANDSNTLEENKEEVIHIIRDIDPSMMILP